MQMKIEKFVCMLDKTIKEKEMCKQHMRYKPHLGKLEFWERQYHGEIKNGEYCIIGLFQGHPKFTGRWGHTSQVISEHENEIETLNSRYTLGTPKLEGYKYL